MTLFFGWRVGFGPGHIFQSVEVVADDFAFGGDEIGGGDGGDAEGFGGG